ncbi:MAG: aspartate aminotransferase family protein [Sphingopyxis sp.]|nr:aspartate aminotransferase family protein [Sphingopyxis sp.]
MIETEKLTARRAAAVATSAATTHPLYIARASGAELWDVDGRRYVDFAAGIAVLNLGHGHPAVRAAIEAQLAAYAHVAFPVNGYEPYIAVCEALNARAPFADARSALFTTGAEAVENAIKVARIATARLGVIAFSGAFHGRTQLAAALSGKIAPLRTGVQPLLQGVVHAPFPGHGTDTEGALASLDEIFHAALAPDQTAAIIIEPVQGEGGFVAAPREFMLALRRLCDAHGIVLIADEIQSGFGRTGRFFAIEHHDIEPDIIAVGKAIGGGLPLAGIVGRAALMNAASPGALGGTFAGNPVSCASALAVFDTIEREGLMARAEHIGAVMRNRIERARTEPGFTAIGAVRQNGAMVAFDVVDAPGRISPARTAEIAARARELGVLFLPCGYRSSTIRLSAPLTIDDALLDEGIGHLLAATRAPVTADEPA